MVTFKCLQVVVTEFDVFEGYQYYEESLIAIARLRCNSLRVLEVASENVFSMFQGSDKAPINLKIVRII